MPFINNKVINNFRLNDFESVDVFKNKSEP